MLGPQAWPELWCIVGLQDPRPTFPLEGSGPGPGLPMADLAGRQRRSRHNAFHFGDNFAIRDALQSRDIDKYSVASLKWYFVVKRKHISHDEVSVSKAGLL